MNFDSGVGVPVVEFVVVEIEDGGDGGTVAVLGLAHDDGADVGEKAMGAVEKVDLGAFDVDFYEFGWRGLSWDLFKERVEGDALDLVGFAGASGLRVFGD